MATVRVRRRTISLPESFDEPEVETMPVRTLRPPLVTNAEPGRGEGRSGAPGVLEGLSVLEIHDRPRPDLRGATAAAQDGQLVVDLTAAVQDPAGRRPSRRVRRSAATAAPPSNPGASVPGASVPGASVPGVSVPGASLRGGVVDDAASHGAPTAGEAPTRGTAHDTGRSSSGRAGRNLPMAILVGATLAGLVLASLLIRKEAWIALVGAAVVLSVWELARGLSAKGISVPVIPLAVGSLGMLVSAFVAGEDGLLVSFGLTAFGAMLWRLIDGVEDSARDVTASVFTAAYVPFLAGFTILMLVPPDGARRVIVFVLVTVASDIGGYAAGVLFGRHPMAPTVSPKKSWEGFAGSAAGCVTVGVLGVVLLLDGPWWAGVAIGAATVVTATLGDLCESLIKRDLGIKDMGQLLPGHGGMLDRIDSLLLSAPVVYVLLSLLV